MKSKSKKTKRKVSARTATGITKLQALKQMKKALFTFKRQIGKILKDNDLFYCADTDIKDRVRKGIRCVDDMVFSLTEEGSLVNCMMMCDLKTRKEALEFGYC